MNRLLFSVVLAIAGVFFVSGAMAQNTTGPVRLGSNSFGKAGFGMPQSLGADVLEEARQLGLFEDTVSIRSGWIDTAARITGRLDIRTAGFDQDGNPINFACTGTAITDRLILTSAHCVPQAGLNRALDLRFLPNYRDARRLNDVIAYQVQLKPVEIGDPQRLDYAILQLRVPLAGYRPMAFSIRDPGPGEPLVIMGHPEGQPLLLSRGRCRSDREVPLSGTDVIHQCATRQGSSGSLVWSSDGQVVGLHYKGGTTLAGQTVNRAVRIAALLPESPTLRQLLAGAIDAPKPSGIATPLNLGRDYVPVKVQDTGERFSFIVQTAMGARSTGSCTFSINNRHIEELELLIREYMPQTRAGHIVIEGHTDSRGDANSNITCSKLVAEAYLQTLKGTGVLVNARDTQVIGYGESRPIASNLDEAGRRKNARIVVSLLY